MDIHCRICGEPYDSIEFDECAKEKRRFRAGEGCPTCDWGTKCPQCKGTGQLPPAECRFCYRDCQHTGPNKDKPCGFLSVPPTSCVFCGGTGKPGAGSKREQAQAEETFLSDMMDATDEPEEVLDLLFRLMGESATG